MTIDKDGGGRPEGDEDRDDGGNIGSGEDLSEADLARIEEMQRETPMPSKNEGGEPPDGSDTSGGDGKPDASKASADDDAELEAGESEIAMDASGRPRDALGKWVSKSAYLRLKEERKTARDETAASREKLAHLEGRFNTLAEILGAVPDGQKKPGDQQQPENPWDEADVDPNEDLFKAFEQQKRRNAFLMKAVKERDTSQTARDSEVAVVRDYVADVRKFSEGQVARGEIVEAGGKKMPAYQAAYQHLVGLRHAQLEAVGITEKAAREAIIIQEERNLVHSAATEKKSPAEAIWKLALASGFKPPNGAGKGDGKSSVEKKIEKRNEDMSRTRSLSDAGGSGYGGLTAKQIINMSDEAFDSFVDKIGEEQLNRLLGAE